MLLLLRRPLRDAVPFCAFEKNREPKAAEKGALKNDRFMRGRKLYK
jgi:hypothetical protein